MKNTAKRQMIGAAAIAALLLLAIAFAAGLSWGSRGGQQSVTASVLSQQLHTIGELATVEYHYTNMGKFENQLDFYGWPVPLTKKSFIVSYDGVIKAGIDASALTCTASKDGLVIQAPAAQILSHAIDFQSLTVFDETRNIFNPISITDYQQFSLDQQSVMEQKVRDGGLLDEACAKAEQMIRQFVQMTAGDAVSVTIKWAS